MILVLKNNGNVFASIQTDENGKMQANIDLENTAQANNFSNHEIVEMSEIEFEQLVNASREPAKKTELEQLKEDNANLNLQYIDLFELLIAQGVI